MNDPSKWLSLDEFIEKFEDMVTTLDIRDPDVIENNGENDD